MLLRSVLESDAVLACRFVGRAQPTRPATSQTSEPHPTRSTCAPGGSPIVCTRICVGRRLMSSFLYQLGEMEEAEKPTADNVDELIMHAALPGVRFQRWCPGRETDLRHASVVNGAIICPQSKAIFCAATGLCGAHQGRMPCAPQWAVGCPEAVRCRSSDSCACAHLRVLPRSFAGTCISGGLDDLRLERVYW